MPDRVRESYHDLGEPETAALLAEIAEQERAQTQLIERLRRHGGLDQTWVAIARMDLAAAIADLRRAIARPAFF